MPTLLLLVLALGSLLQQPTPPPVAGAGSGDEQRAANLASLAVAAGQAGDLLRAQTYLVEALALAEARGDLRTIQATSNNLGIVQRRLGDHEGALTHFTRALELAEQFKRPDQVARALNNLGLLQQNLGNATLALEYYTRSLKLKEANGAPPQELSSTIGNIGGMYDEQGDYAQAIDYFQRALALVEGEGPSATMTTALSNLGHAHAALYQYPEARAFYARALKSAEQMADRSRIATILYNIGTIERDESRLDDAEAKQRQSLAIRDELGDRIGVVESRTELGHLALARGKIADARAHAEQAIALASASRLLNQLWKAQWLAAEVEQRAGAFEPAASRYSDTIDTIETLRQLTAGGDRTRVLYLSERQGPYYGLARLHATAHRGLDALQVIERARARTLLDILGGGRLPVRALPAEEQAQERALTQAVVSWSSQLAIEAGRPKPDPARLAAIDRDLERARLARDAFTTQLYASRPDLRLARGLSPIVTREQLASLIAPGTAAVVFAIEERRVWRYLVTANAQGVVVSPQLLKATGEDVARLAQRFADQVASRDVEFGAGARQLYTALFADVDRALARVRHLVVVPDGALWRVPFQALISPRGRFLIEERAVSYTPSLSALAALDERRRARTNQRPHLVALGDPSTGAPRLPEAQREVQALGRLYGTASSHVVVGGNATERALRDLAPRASVLHIATHGVVDDKHPMYSHLLLAAAADQPDRDGRLEAWEVMDLPLNADLVVLSACETARGVATDGEGVVGLTWSLFAAGASTAVVSQWAVDSTSTTALMIAFHQARLQPRMSTASALRAAARTLLATPAYRHPFYWAGFVSVGAP